MSEHDVEARGFFITKEVQGHGVSWQGDGDGVL